MLQLNSKEKNICALLKEILSPC